MSASFSVACNAAAKAGRVYVTVTGTGPYSEFFHGTEAIQGTLPESSPAYDNVVYAAAPEVISVYNAAGDANGNPPAASHLVVTRSFSLPADCPAPKTYIALGDSFSSGEGVPPFLAGSAQAGDSCHRSTKSYSELVSASTLSSYTPHFEACSGSLINDFYTANHADPSEPPQIDYLGSSTGLVTLTIGGNDAHFKDVMTYCAVTRAVDLTSCMAVWNARVNSAISALAGPASQSDTYAGLFSALVRKAPNARIYVLGYPRFFATKPTVACTTGSPTGLRFQISDQVWIDSEVSKLDGVIAVAAKAAGITYVNTYDMVGTSHDLCSTAPWINKLVLSHTEYSFHPNASGQAAFAAELSTSIG